MRFTVFGAQALLLQMCFWKETQTLKYLSVRGEEPCDPKCFQPSGKGPEEPVFLHLKKGARASPSTGAGNASADGDEIIPRRAVFLLLKKTLALLICEHKALAIWQMNNKVILKAEHHLVGISLCSASQSRRERFAFSLLLIWAPKSLGSVLS